MAENTGFSIADYDDAARALGECLQDLEALSGHLNRQYIYPTARIYGTLNAIKRAGREIETVTRLLREEVRDAYPFMGEAIKR